MMITSNMRKSNNSCLFVTTLFPSIFVGFSSFDVETRDDDEWQNDPLLIWCWLWCLSQTRSFVLQGMLFRNMTTKERGARKKTSAGPFLLLEKKRSFQRDLFLRSRNLRSRKVRRTVRRRKSNISRFLLVVAGGEHIASRSRLQELESPAVIGFFLLLLPSSSHSFSRSMKSLFFSNCRNSLLVFLL